MSYLDASSVDVLVEAALRVARIERRRVALQDIEAVGGVRIARINARYEVPGVGPGHVAAADQFVPSDELRTKTLDWPLASSPFQTTWTPLASAVTAERLANLE